MYTSREQTYVALYILLNTVGRWQTGKAVLTITFQNLTQKSINLSIYTLGILQHVLKQPYYFIK
jgi:hypothetical protein